MFQDGKVEFTVSKPRWENEFDSPILNIDASVQLHLPNLNMKHDYAKVRY